MKPVRPMIHRTLLIASLLMLTTYAANAEDSEMPVQNSVSRPKVSVEQVQTADITQWVMTQGRASAIRHEYLNFERPGKVRYIARGEGGRQLRAGDKVRGPIEGEKFGQLLAQLDSREDLERVRGQKAALVAAQRQVDSMTSALEQSRANAQQAEKDFQRAEEIFAKGAYSQGQFDQIKTQHINAQAEVKRAQAALASSRSQVKTAVSQLNAAKIGLEKTSIFAPFDGVISYLNIRKGDYSNGQPMAGADAQRQSNAAIVVVDNSAYEITLEVPFYQANHLSEGQPAFIAPSAISLTAAASGNFNDSGIASGEVYSVSPSISLAGRTVQVKVRTNNKVEQLRDGLPVSVWIASQQANNTLSVNENAVQYRGTGSFAYVVNDAGIIEKRQLVLGLEGLDKYQVIEGLEKGESVVTGGAHLVFDGSQVEVVSTPTEGAQ